MQNYILFVKYWDDNRIKKKISKKKKITFQQVNYGTLQEKKEKDEKKKEKK